MRLGDLIHGLDVRLAGLGAALGDLRICDLTEDSRTAMPGSLFIARKGEKSDGTKFIGAAIEAGAAAVLVDDASVRLPALPKGHHEVALLVTGDILLASAQMAERFYGSPSSRLIMIGVTGTKGKTTTAYLIHQILNALGVRTGMIGTVCIDDGVEVAPASLTTPPALEVSCTLGRMVEAGCAACVMEVSSHALHQRRVGAAGGVEFRAGMFTNLTGDHLDYHGTMEEYAAAKAMLFAGLPTAEDGGVAVVNIMDPAHSGMVKGCRARVLRCSIDKPLAVRGGGTAPETLCTAKVLREGADWTEVEFVGPWGHHACRVPLAGEFNVMNALQAAAVVHGVFGGTGEDDFSFAIIAEALARCGAPPGRMEPVTAEGAEITVLVDYAHTDDALKNVLTTVRGTMARGCGGGGKGELWCVFGCGGDRDRTKRPRMGKVASELADRIVITSDNPRTESADGIIAEVLSGVAAESQPRVKVEADRERAIGLAVKGAKAGDVVVIAGKGHETYQILPDPRRAGGTVTREFDDREVARMALRARGVAVREKRVECEEEEDDLEGEQGSLGEVGVADRQG
ncbi:MAG: UDP-N-acetylmuramoyl-L-alanyl-D-glutamate--2,6-diaminopimelate ligase [Phycisphaerales bacterium]|nr:UDP-N-acetylmuramoyl-L-alanyl-D-glutamate--2,6-diaminopimelate ligase [Phycisphaerales bacterium]